MRMSDKHHDTAISMSLPVYGPMSTVQALGYISVHYDNCCRVAMEHVRVSAASRCYPSRVSPLASPHRTQAGRNS